MDGTEIKSNTFELQAELDGVCLFFQIQIDGKSISDDPVDLLALVDSLRSPGEHYIFTCDCGIPACARIEQGVNVTHAEGLIHWELIIPVSWADSPGSSIDEKYSHWRSHSYKATYVFRRDQMELVTRECLTKAQKLAQTKVHDFSPSGFTRNHLEGLII